LKLNGLRATSQRRAHRVRARGHGLPHRDLRPGRRHRRPLPLRRARPPDRARTTTALQLVADDALRINADAAATAAHGAWPLFGPVASDDIPELAEMKRALGDFAVSAPACA
jgi:hypothetical protein